MATNDVPEYLNELIPYRCPKCGHLRRFATLRELRQHLQSEHSFQMGFIKPHARTQVFKGRDSSNSSSFARSLSSEEMFNATSSKYERDTVNELRRNNDEYDWNKKFRETSPLLKSFKDETVLLEKELQQARQNEMKHKTLSMHNLADSSISTDFKTSLETIRRPNEPEFKPENTDKDFTTSFANNYPSSTHRNFVEKTKIYTSPTRGQFGSSYDFKSTMDSLNSEVMKSRMNQWVTTDALYKSQDLLREMETAAEKKCEEQKGVIEQLVQEMKAKDAMLDSRTKQQAELSSERQRLLDETETIVKQTDDYNTRLRHELDGRGKVLEGLNKELEKLKMQSENEIKSKEYDLKNATQTINQLEWERDRLIQETDGILKRADHDTGKLKQTLQAKEEELKNVSKTLNQLRQHQQSMLEKTMTVYRSSEESKEIMKTAIQTKDGQLQHAMKQIENMTSLHKRLLEQSQILTDQADDNTSSMKRLLNAKGEQIQDLVQQLDTLKREKRYLEDNTTSLAEQAETSMSVVENLRDMVKQKECDLKTTQSELQNLKSFLKTTADKEKVARQKLEVFIEDLIKRAEVAESELHVLKSQSTNSSSTLRDVKIDSLSDIHQDESTERKSLPLQGEPLNYTNATTIYQDPSLHSQRENMHLGRENVDSVIKNELASHNTFITTADVHTCDNIEVNKDIEAQTSVNDRTQTANNTRNMLDVRGHRLEESGGFIVQGENSISEENSYLQGQEYLTVNNKHVKHGNHSEKNNRRNKFDDSSKRHDRYYPITPNSNEAIGTGDEFQDHQKGINYFNTLETTVCPPYKRRDRNDSEDETEGFTDDSDTHDLSDTEYYTIQGRSMKTRYRKGRKISRGLQVGAFLSTQDLDNAVEDDSDVSDEGSYTDDIEYKNEVRGIAADKKYGSENQSKRIDERPVTMGKSPKTEGIARRSNKKSNRQPKRTLNRKFDTQFPTSHTSMINITSDRLDLSEGEILLRNGDRNRRSRSLSPKTLGARSSYQTGEIVDYFSDTSICEDVTSEDDGLDKGGLDKTDGVFRNIMDDNGILWDDDMATLPDVSDSEFDRVSPSGSEALATKNTCNTVTTAYSNHQGSPQTPITKDTTVVKSHAKVAPDETEEISISKVAHLLNSRSKQGNSVRQSDRQRISSRQSKESTYKKDFHRNLSSDISDDEILKKNNEYTRTDLNTTKVHFRPIKSPPFSKSSTSDKDLTSGGKEVKTIMETFPKIDVIGTSASGSASRRSTTSNSRSASRESRNVSEKDVHRSYKKSGNLNVKDPERENSTHSQSSRYSTAHVGSSYTLKTETRKKTPEITTSAVPNQFSSRFTKDGTLNSTESNTRKSRDYTESVDKKIERISSKYSPKYADKPTKAEDKSPFNLDEKIKSINNKYKIRREDILQGKGVGQSHIDLSSTSVASNRSISTSATSLSFDKRLSHVQNGKPISVPSDSVLLHSKTLVKQGTQHLPSSPLDPLVNSQHMENPLNTNKDYPPWPYINNQNNGQECIGYPYMQYPMPYPYPPNWNQYPPLPFHPEHPEQLRQQQQQQQQQQQDEQQKQQQQQEQQIIQTLQQQLQETQQQLKHSQQQTGTSEDIAPKKQKQNAISPCAERANGIKSRGIMNKDQFDEKEKKEYEQCHISDIKQISGTQSNIYSYEENSQMLTAKSDIESEGKIQHVPVDTNNTRGENQAVPVSFTVAEAKRLEIPTVEMKSDILKSPGPAELLQKRSMETANASRSDSIKMHDDREDYSDIQDHVSHTTIQRKGFMDTSDTDVRQFDNKQTRVDLSNEVLSPHSIGNINDSQKKSDSRLLGFDDTDNEDSSLGLSKIIDKSSIFAEEIGEESSVEYDSNTQSYLDLPGAATDTDIDGDTDTESVRRDFYENTHRIKELLDGPHNDFSDVYRHKLSRNTTSSASSQASLEILDRVPLAKREQVKQRRAALVCIFSFLDTRTLSRVARVCREWRIVSRSPKLWRRVELRGEKISPKFLRQLSRRCSQLRILILEDLHPRNRKPKETVEDYQKNIRCSLEAGYEQILKKAEATLHTIVVVNCGILFSAKCLWIASCCCRMLKHVTYISDFDPINAEVMWALGSGCRELKTLKCQPIFPCANADNFTTKCAQLVGKCFRDLEIVSIGGLIVDVNALIFIAKQCQKLRQIEVHQMKFISCDTIDEMCQNGLQSLKNIQFHATPVAPGALTVLHGVCNFLEAVYIQLTESDFIASVTNQGAATHIPEYPEIIDGYEALKKQPSLCNILTLKLERPKRPPPAKEPVQERSFFDRLFGKNE